MTINPQQVDILKELSTLYSQSVPTNELECFRDDPEFTESMFDLADRGLIEPGKIITRMTHEGGDIIALARINAKGKDFLEDVRTREILQKLMDKDPSPLFVRDFAVPQKEEQSFLNLLHKLNRRELITGQFEISGHRDTVGLPTKVVNLRIANKGEQYMKGETDSPPAHVTQNNNITITANGEAKVPLNIAAGDVNITSNADAEKLLQTLLEHLENSNLKPEEKKGLRKMLKASFDVSKQVVAGLFVSAINSIKG